MIDIKETLRQHSLWLVGVTEGRRADLSDADLSDADLRRANLRRANLSDADLRRANLSDADLRRANLIDAYLNIPVDRNAVLSVIVANAELLDMSRWHTSDAWHNGQVHSYQECNTNHCMAGFAHVEACKVRPELMDEKINVELVGRLVLGDEAAEHFYDSNEDALAWIKEQLA